MSQSAKCKAVMQLGNDIINDVDISANKYIIDDLGKGSICRAIFGLKLEQLRYNFDRMKPNVVYDLR